MKKKLIAIVTSLAMVATMVPSMAFAAQTKAAPGPGVHLSTVDEIAADSLAGKFRTQTGETLNDGLTVDPGTGNISGTVHYAEGFKAWWGIDENAAFDDTHPNWADCQGNFVAFTIAAPKPADAAVKGWAYIFTNSDDNGKKVEVHEYTSDPKSEYEVLTKKLGSTTVSLPEGEIYYLTEDGLSALQALAGSGTEIRVAEADWGTWKTTNLVPDTNVSGDAAEVPQVGGTVTNETKQEADDRKETAATKNAIDQFLNAVKAIALPITTYDKHVDEDVEKACAAYDVLTAANVTAIKDDAANRTIYEQFERAVEQQWDARLDALDYAVKDVTPVEMGVTDKDSVAAVAALEKYCEDITYTGSPAPKMYSILTSTTGGAPSILNNNGTLRNAITTTVDDANTALAEAKAAEPIVVAIAKLENVTDRNYEKVATQIATIKTDYERQSKAVQDRVGNYEELEAKEKAAAEYAKEVTDAKELIVEISKNLDNGNLQTGKLTEKEIKAYTEAYNAAEKAYNALGREQRLKIKNDDVIVDGQTKKYKDLFDLAASNVIRYGIGLDKEIAVKDAISNLPAGTAAGDTLAIAEAWVDFYGLSPAAPGTIGSLAAGFRDNINSVLQSRLSKAAAAILPTLKENGTNKADEDAIAAAVAPVKALIAALPATITSADKADVDAALYAYGAITSAFNNDSVVDTALEKALRDDEKVLRKAETQIKEIIAKNKQAVERFIDAVKAIDADLDMITDEDPVDIDYRNLTAKARTIYDALTDEQKDMVQKNGVTDAKKAYDALLIAEKNVAAAVTLDQVAALIKAVPDAATLKLDDTDAVAKVKAAQAAYEALTEGVKDQLLANKFVTQSELDNYKQAVKKVTDAESKTSVKEVTAAIKALTPLPTRFSNQTEVTTVYTLLAQAEELFNKLTKEQQASVTNKDVLTKYRTDFDRLMKTYASDLYKKAAALDLNGTITAEDIAVIAELKAYVDGEYIETTEIAGFDQKVYDALIALLDANAALENATIADIPAVTYTGAEQKPAVTVTDKSGKAVPTDAYEVTYSNNEDAGTALVTVSALTGKGYTGVTSKAFTINPANIKTAAKAAAIAKQVYNKKAKKPAVSVTAGSKKLVKDADYKVAYKNNTNIGKATVTITGTDNYTGTITTTFIITPAKGKLTSLKAGKKQITVSYEAQKASGKTGYYLVYSPAKGKAKTTTTTSTKKTIKGLKSGKTYKVKVRAYKTIGGTKYYGKYSDVKKVRVK